MLRRLPFLLAVPFLASLAPAAESVYTLRFPEAAAHYVDVEAVFPTGGRDAVEVFMPVWTPGSYLVREYARNILTLSAADPAGAALTAEKVAKNRWRIAAAGRTEVVVRYRLYAREINVRGNWVEGDFAVLNGAPTFLAPVDGLAQACRVRLELPAGWTGTHTPLAPGGSPHEYTAPDFDTLVDSPMIAGSPQVDRFDVDGVPHYLVTLGGAEAWDNARVARNLAKLVETQRTYWGGLPYRTPFYFFNLLTGSRGGLEHRNSVMITADRWLARTRGGIGSWLSLASHEYFHAWNGKRLRPAELGPFDYEHEVYTRSLWIVEGLTSYAQHLLLARAGFTTPEQFLGALSGSIAGVQRTPGRLVQSLADSSYDSWIKAYRPDENSVNALFSYYGGGAVAGLLFDVEIRRVSNGTRSLDDVLRAAYARYSGERGYTEAEFVALASEVAGQDLRGWVKRVIATPGEFDYQPLLDWFGLAFETPPARSTERLPNQLEPADPAPAWLGADTRDDGGRLMVTAVRHGTPAAAAGLSVGDEIIAIGAYRVTPAQWAARLAVHRAGEKVDLVLARQDRLVTVPVTFGEEPRETWKLKFRPDATPEQKARVADWLKLAP